MGAGSLPVFAPTPLVEFTGAVETGEPGAWAPLAPHALLPMLPRLSCAPGSLSP